MKEKFKSRSAFDFDNKSLNILIFKLMWLPNIIFKSLLFFRKPYDYNSQFLYQLFKPTSHNKKSAKIS